ncbi:RNA polymerase sigma factor [Sulfuriroseicoccus oceanibius]|uniref:Sigma-70 family RNA polymerase sigma factor n=1 Tax=Sulfuriroseicoccus oceanibius TaxID=2707525 RepID=A0A6B3LBD2_9BACT|nr:sigma-70 family RNA polymerase sigma factor [Sulfuriroseicoccus oceanibius]QQL45964.1 sigma-70 family RNA polymerase sigma factor [Sulfuriroseicoccus oceanibius]
MKTSTRAKNVDPEELQKRKEEEALILGVADGDLQKFAELHQRFSGLVYATVYKVLNDVQDTEDVAQEVFSMIWNKADQYRVDKGKPLTWITTMARNRAIDRLRAKQRRARLTESFKEQEEGHESRRREDSLRLVEWGDRNRTVRSAVMELSEPQREAIQMVYFSGLTQAEAADQLGEPLGTVKARIRRGILRLRKVMPLRL